MGLFAFSKKLWFFGMWLELIESLFEGQKEQ